MNEGWRLIARDCAAIVVVAIVGGVALNLLHPRGYALMKKEGPVGGQIVFIGLDEARIKHQSPAVRFIDAREPEEFAAGRIPGAVNIPAVQGAVPRFDDEASPLGPATEVVLYCDGPACGAAEKLAGRIIDAGYRRHVYILRDGYPGWTAAGLPREQGDTR